MAPAWRAYETFIMGHLRRLYPEADIQADVRRTGVVSQVPRQIDLLVTAQVIGFPILVVIDCKCFSRKVHVKDVEAFLAFLDDLKVSKGIMITNIGYSDTAYQRATRDTRDVELRIIRFDELEHLQAFGGIIYAGSHGAIVSAPDGWVLDATRMPGFLACLYPLGLKRDEALHHEGFIYLNFSTKTFAMPGLTQLLEHQEVAIRQTYQSPRFEYTDAIRRPDCATRMRQLEASELGETIEYTIFLDFPEAILFVNLLAPRTKRAAYLRKLEWLVEKIIKLRVVVDARGSPLTSVREGVS